MSNLESIKNNADLHKMISSISNELFKPDSRRLLKDMAELVQANKALVKDANFSFAHRGEIFFDSTKSSHVTGPGAHVSVHVSLIPRVDAWLKDRKEITTDQKQIEQILYILFYQCCNQQEIRDSMPDCILHLAPDFIRAIPRKMANNEFIVRHNERELRQYRKLLPKIQLYAAAGLLY